MKNFLLVFVLGFVFAISVKANIEITEIMYDTPGSDTDREWIEVQNTGGTAVDISGYKLFEANTNHSLVSFQGGVTLQPGAFAVIADKPENFLTDNTGFSGILFDSSFLLSNAGELLTIRDSSGSTIDSVTFDPTLGANGDGQTLQKINGSWLVSASSAGALNREGEETSAEYVASNSSLQISAGGNRLVAAGSPIDFQAKISSNTDKQTIYEWSLGDGFIAYGEVVQHMYSFAGDYVVVLNVKGKNQAVVSRINVRVIEPTINISEVDGGIKIKNTGKDEINLFKWMISSGNTSYTFPTDLIVMPGKTIAIDSRIFRAARGGKISLIDTMGRAVVNSNNFQEEISGNNKNPAAASLFDDGQKNVWTQSIRSFLKNIFSVKQ